MARQCVIYNTATLKKEPFTPLRPGRVSMYCCGPTVYNYAHIGNLRTYVFEDVLRRALQSLGLAVTHVVNITDVGHLTSDADTGDDKMEKGARREGRTVWEIAEFYTEKFRENMRDLNILEPSMWPRATDHIGEMIDMVRKLEEKGIAYRTGDGIYFDTSKFPSYCDFARLDPQELKAGIRVEMGGKRHATDFALWKFSPPDAKRQMEWESPWGTGFPGWHIECSAMALKYLGQPIDIHCGGADHIRVHHTNEIAQVEAVTGRPFVRYWVHGEWLVVEKGKMSKSSGEFITLDTIREAGIAPLTLRMFCYSAHYRTPLSFSWEGLSAAARSLANLKRIISAETGGVPDGGGKDEGCGQLLDRFHEAVYDDLNMPRAMAALWDMVKDRPAGLSVRRRAVEEADRILGLDLLAPDTESPEVAERVLGDGTKVVFVARDGTGPELLDDLAGKIARRKEARERREYAAADALRDELARQGVSVKDLPDGSVECTINESLTQARREHGAELAGHGQGVEKNTNRRENV
jgi:cysteinyl-tRNA synthetase